MKIRKETMCVALPDIMGNELQPRYEDTYTIPVLISISSCGLSDKQVENRINKFCEAITPPPRIGNAKQYIELKGFMIDFDNVDVIRGLVSISKRTKDNEIEKL